MHRNEVLRRGSSGLVGVGWRGGSSPGVDGHKAVNGEDGGGVADGGGGVVLNACGSVRQCL